LPPPEKFTNEAIVTPDPVVVAEIVYPLAIIPVGAVKVTRLPETDAEYPDDPALMELVKATARSEVAATPETVPDKRFTPFTVMAVTVPVVADADTRKDPDADEAEDGATVVVKLRDCVLLDPPLTVLPEATKAWLVVWLVMVMVPPEEVAVNWFVALI
jgi:hypothetical protein